MADPVFLITGASSGIGAATARRAAEAGYRLVLAARSKDKLDALADELGGKERAIAVQCDVTDFSQQEAMMAAARYAFDRVDVVFANAGFGAKRGFLEETPEHWRDMVLTNVLGAAYTIRAAIPALKETKGHLLLTSSVAGRRVLSGSLYSATKHAVTAMAEAARQDLDDSGVRVTSIEPGMVDTPFFENRPTGALEPDDIARAVLYAVSQPPHVDVNEILIRPTSQRGPRRRSGRARRATASPIGRLWARQAPQVALVCRRGRRSGRHAATSARCSAHRRLLRDSRDSDRARVGPMLPIGTLSSLLISL